MATAAATLLDAETFSASSERDALGRVLTAVSPDGSEVHYHYDEGGALQRVTLHHRGSTTEQTPVGEITYDAKGRRESITHGPLASPTSTTNYTYDPRSQRLTRLRTVRASDDEAIQSLHYHYDAVGNITDIRDTAQQTVYFQNSVVEAANSYTYDGLYRLIEATGREHASEGTSQRTHTDLTATPQPMTSDPSAMRRYTQQYVYDEVGNILEMRHIPATGTGWTRYYEYDEAGNRLLATSAPGDDPEGPYSHEYPYDAHGNMTAMPHLSSMVWNHDDELVSAVAGTETVYFQYAGGNRARKYTEKSGSTTEERIYLGNFEIYRKRVSGSIDVERESLHVADDTGRILLIETKTIDASSAVTTPTGIWRYQLSNHLGSAATELTEDGDIISYEEYHPYGDTSYRAVDSSIDVSAKRYRYTGMERDEETGLAYHTARYYASWLGRWTASDPIGVAGCINRFAFSSCSPVVASDLSGLVDRPTDAEWADYSKEAASHNSSVHTWHAQVALFDPNGSDATNSALLLDAERRRLYSNEVALWARYADLRARTMVADLEDARARAHEYAGPDSWTISGKNLNRIFGMSMAFGGVAGALGTSGVGGVIGADFIQAGLRQAWTGEQASTVMRSGAELVSEAAGNSVLVAQIHGDMAETLVPVTFGAVSYSHALIREAQVARMAGVSRIETVDTPAGYGTRFNSGQGYTPRGLRVRDTNCAFVTAGALCGMTSTEVATAVNLPEGPLNQPSDLKFILNELGILNGKAEISHSVAALRKQLTGHPVGSKFAVAYDRPGAMGHVVAGYRTRFGVWFRDHQTTLGVPRLRPPTFGVAPSTYVALPVK